VTYLSPFELSRDFAHFYRQGQTPPTLEWHIAENLQDPNYKPVVVVDEVDAGRPRRTPYV
jgi:hypothetical protein